MDTHTRHWGFCYACACCHARSCRLMKQSIVGQSPDKQTSAVPSCTSDDAAVLTLQLEWDTIVNGEGAQTAATASSDSSAESRVSAASSLSRQLSTVDLYSPTGPLGSWGG